MRVLYTTTSRRAETFLRPEVQRLGTCGVYVEVRGLRDLTDWPSPISMVLGGRGVLGAFRRLAIDRSNLDAKTRLKNWMAALQAAGFASDLLSANFDAVHAYWASAPATVAVLLAARWSIPFSFTGHRWDIYARQLLAAKADRASFIRAISSRGADLLVQLMPKHRELVKIVHVGVDVPAPAKRPLSPGPPRLLAVGNLFPVKGHSVLLSALELIVDEGLPLKLDLVGSGPELHHLQTQASRAPRLQGRIRFLGQLSHREVLNLMSDDYNAIVHSSISGSSGLEEGVPVVLLEAAARRLPIVATMSGATSELVTKSTGWPCEPNSPSTLAQAILASLTSPLEALERADHAFELINEVWNVEKTARQMADLFHETTPLRDRR